MSLPRSCHPGNGAKSIRPMTCQTELPNRLPDASPGQHDSARGSFGPSPHPTSKRGDALCAVDVVAPALRDAVGQAGDAVVSTRADRHGGTAEVRARAGCRRQFAEQETGQNESMSIVTMDALQVRDSVSMVE